MTNCIIFTSNSRVRFIRQTSLTCSLRAAASPARTPKATCMWVSVPRRALSLLLCHSPFPAPAALQISRLEIRTSVRSTILTDQNSYWGKGRRTEWQRENSAHPGGQRGTPAKGVLEQFSRNRSFAEKQWLKIDREDKRCPGKYQTLWACCFGYQLPPAQGSMCTCLCVSGMQVRLGLHLAASFTPSTMPGTIMLVGKPAQGQTLSPFWALNTDTWGLGRSLDQHTCKCCWNQSPWGGGLLSTFIRDIIYQVWGHSGEYHYPLQSFYSPLTWTHTHTYMHTQAAALRLQILVRRNF